MPRTNQIFVMKDWHRDFCRKYLESGRNGTEAFMAVRPKAKYESARAGASTLLKHQEIKDEIRRIEAEIRQENKMDFQQRLEVLSAIIRTGTEASKIKAIEVMNKMEGIGVPQVPMQTVNLNGALDGLSKEDLMKLIDGGDEQ